jgi:hypothetical protein
MKWMMWSGGLMIAVVLSVAVGAQAGTKDKGDKVHKKKLKASAYSGCLETGVSAGTFMLTDIAADHVGKGTLNKKGTIKKDTRMPTVMTLTSVSVDLSEHLGQEVSVTGSVAHGKDATANDADAFNVESLTMVAASCS